MSYKNYFRTPVESFNRTTVNSYIGAPTDTDHGRKLQGNPNEIPLHSLCS